MSHKSEAKALRDGNSLGGKGFSFKIEVGAFQRNSLTDFHEEVICATDYFSFNLFGFNLRRTHFLLIDTCTRVKQCGEEVKKETEITNAKMKRGFVLIFLG